MDTVVEILVICALVFLFWGEPDVWDKLHAYAMAMEVCR